MFRGGYSISFNQLGTNFFTSNYGTNPGRTRSRQPQHDDAALRRSAPMAGFPVLLRDTAQARIRRPFPASPTYPLTPAINEIDRHPLPGLADYEHPSVQHRHPA